MKANEVSEDNEGHVDFLENAARQNDGCCSFFVAMKAMKTTKTMQPDRMMACQDLEK